MARDKKKGPRKDPKKLPTFRVSCMKKNSQSRLRTDEVNYKIEIDWTNSFQNTTCQTDTRKNRKSE